MSYAPKLYLETTIFNFYFLEKESQKVEATYKLFEAIGKGKYAAFTSDYVLKELARANPIKYRKMASLIEKYVNYVVFLKSDIDFLADVYVEKGIIPEKYITDARHIAVATVCDLDFVVSFNMGHIVKSKTMIGTGFANLRHGYRQVGLCSPREIIEYGFD